MKTDKVLVGVHKDIVHAVEEECAALAFTLCGYVLGTNLPNNYDIIPVTTHTRVTCRKCLSIMRKMPTSDRKNIEKLIDKENGKMTSIAKPAKKEYYYEVHDVHDNKEDVFADTVEAAAKQYCHVFHQEIREIEYILLIEVVTKYIPQYSVKWIKE